MLTLSILDQSIATAGRSQAEAIRNTLALAPHVERMGYRRFWVSEHHNNATIVGTAPEVLLGALAATTSTIRIGSAGVMLPHYAPFKVAEQFRVLDALAPGRIDLGLGRAPGSDGRTAYALNPNAAERPAQFPSDIIDLHAWINGGGPREGTPFSAVRAFPASETAPQIWVLGSSDYGAQVAAHFGLPYAFAWFFTDGQGCETALRFYRDTYKPSVDYPEPHAALCVWALAADTAEEARFHFASRARFRLMRDRGQFLPLETPEAALAHEYTEADRARMDGFARAAFIGTGADVASRIRALAAETGVQEIAIVTWATDEAVRIKSYRLIAEAMGIRA